METHFFSTPGRTEIGGNHTDHNHGRVLAGSVNMDSIEVLIGIIFNSLFNEGSITPESIAIIGQYAENKYFGKPCGLMDQVACAMGGIVTIDFEIPLEPVIKKVDFDFDAQDYNLLVVDSGGTHADLTDDYASVPSDMKSIARALGKEVCREISMDDLISNIEKMRLEAGDRALLRAFHFIGDNERVTDQVEALENNDFNTFLDLVKDSGNSSYKWPLERTVFMY